MWRKHKSQKVMEIQFRWGFLEEINALRLEVAVISLSNVCMPSGGLRKWAYMEYRSGNEGKEKAVISTYARDVLDLRKHKLYLRLKGEFQEGKHSMSWKGRKPYQAHDFGSLKDREESLGCFKTGKFVLRLHYLFVSTTSNSAKLFIYF